MKKLFIAVIVSLALSFAILAHAADIYEKVDANTLKVTATTTAQESVTYDQLTEIKVQVERQLAQLETGLLAEYNRVKTALNGRLAEVNKLLAEADKLGIVAKPTEEAPVEEVQK